MSAKARASGEKTRLEVVAARILKEAPDGPGVYLMMNNSGKVFYVGKAKSLKKRMHTYLRSPKSDIRYFVGQLSNLLFDVHFNLTLNEKEAILLENELIKRHQPKFNVQLRDDKNFLHLRLRNDQDFPRLEIVRQRKNDSARYFGPYDSARSIRDTLHILNRHFQLRTCTDSDFKGRTRACLEHQIGRCPAPCVLDIPKEDYADSVRDASLFLSGNPRQLLKTLGKRMKDASEAMRFEQARRFRDQIQAIKRSLVRQDVLLNRDENLDVIALATSEERAVFEVSRYRDGYPLGSRSYPAPRSGSTDPAALMASFIHQLYNHVQDIPQTILTNVSAQMSHSLEEVLSNKACRKTSIRVPKRGRKRKLMGATELNARHRLSASEDEHNRRMDRLSRLQEKFHLRNIPARIECYDISNIHGTDAVGSMVVFTDGAPDRAGYRKFKIKTVDGIDDFAMMAEMLTRRFNDGEKLGPPADLVVLDGGKAHLNAVIKALEKEEHTGLEICALAKEKREVLLAARTKTTERKSDPFARRPERVYLPEARDPVPLKNSDPVTHLLAWLRDEAHRFAITFHRKKRMQRTIRSQLDTIKGVGPKRRSMLLKTFGSVDGLRGISAHEIADRARVPIKVAALVEDALKDEAQQSPKSS
jgi:excinuclease ABC subunit C